MRLAKDSSMPPHYHTGWCHNQPRCSSTVQCPGNIVKLPAVRVGALRFEGLDVALAVAGQRPVLNMALAWVVGRRVGAHVRRAAVGAGRAIASTGRAVPARAAHQVAHHLAAGCHASVSPEQAQIKIWGIYYSPWHWQ
jgi:hypothetical protein